MSPAVYEFARLPYIPSSSKFILLIWVTRNIIFICLLCKWLGRHTIR